MTFQYWWLLCFPLDCKGSRGPWGERAELSLPPVRCLLHNGDRKMLQNQIREAVWAGWRVFVQERGFISAKHSQEFRFGIVHPIPAFHRKLCIKSNWKTPKDISFVASRLTGSTANKPRGFLIWNHKNPSFKRNWQHGKVLWSTGPAARAHGRRSARARTCTWWPHAARVRLLHFFPIIFMQVYK